MQDPDRLAVMDTSRDLERAIKSGAVLTRRRVKVEVVKAEVKEEVKEEEIVEISDSDIEIA